ncbi:MAG TPA: phosphodiesterase [Burkholderiaceae bacterium]|jgi:3',5'-cyclic AMP phosphodiesterase CpdA|nr:phosphodiesterase [Burkholderiaceae bacterium]
MLLCQITDLHVTAGRAPAYGRVDTAACLERCVQCIVGLDPRPDLVIATGDLVDEPGVQSYGLLREILRGLPQPVYLLPGNHDERRALRAAFAQHAYLQGAGEFLQYAVADHPVRLLALDTVIPGQPGGRLCPQRLQWLERRLGESDTPTVIALHHPPFATGIGHMDQMALEDPAQLARIVRRYPQVQRIICGHLHRPIQALFAGTLASVCPSTAHQVLLDLQPGSAARFVMEPPAFQLHRWDGRTLVTHTAYTGHYDGPYPFD